MNPVRSTRVILVLAPIFAGLFIIWVDTYTLVVGTAAIILAALTAANLRFGKSLLYPPALFCAVWTMLLACLGLSGSYFFPVSWQTLAFYVLGAIAFSLGGCANRAITRLQPAPLPPTPPERARYVDLVLTACTVVFLCSIPFYLRYVQELADTSPLANFNPMWAIRDALIKSGEEGGVKPLGQFIFDSLSGYPILAAFIASLEERRSLFQRCRYYVLIGVALFFNLATAGRVGAFLLLVGLVALLSIRRGRINFRLVGAGALIFILAFAPAAILMNKGGDLQWSLKENAVGVAESFADYSLTGVVAFDRIVQNPAAIPPVWRISRSFLHIATRMGFDVYVPPIHAEFTPIRPGMAGNVYTMYFAYLPDFGWLSTMALVFLIGMTVSWMYRRAVEGDRIHAMLFGLLASYSILSGFNENFFGQLNFNLKCIAVGWIFYRMPLFWLVQGRAADGLSTRRSGYPRSEIAAAVPFRGPSE